MAEVEHDCFPEGEPIVLRLAPDYGVEISVEVPLWPSSDDTDALVPEPLLVKLKKWQRDFASNYRYEGGWVSDEARIRWATQAGELEAELRAVLAGKAELVVDLWPLRHPKGEG